MPAGGRAHRPRHAAARGRDGCGRRVGPSGRAVRPRLRSLAMKRRIEPSDIIPDADYVKLRAAKRRELSELKKLRRIEVGPFAMFAFESWDTMWFQVQEMLHIEKGGADQIPDEIAAYNPLIPQGSELVATVMFQI